ncbi:Histidine kinase-, DNA gyrase B-, and HSP90-like ATPase [Nocardioides alpinus]|uniref:Oxygen sensor histidine kinase NreB n=1 Tax=Nocardioides alpinus TaxID=748909 RepID=A0A1I0XW55_9ACTN|nr:sensor histidine kinase [Nocardioides alpinus]PKH42865.1 sensor histidine kinase [Nocardioides alpinus]SFB04398.1 Histidine kinase-, DNA gyrase B-, and HSP90-like ATPase [Nocardioides alpinus]
MRWLTNPVAQFLAAGFVTLVVVVLVTSALSREAADEEAIADARSLTGVLGRSVAQPAIPEGLVTGDAAAIDRLDRTVLDRLLVDDVRRIKVWAADGTILYSDRTELIGAVYPLGDDELDVIEEGGTDAELSDLTRPENRYERELGGDLLEVYTRIRSPEGEPLLFEAYFTADELGQQRAAVLDRFLPITIGALAALVALTTPLIWLLARRLSRGARERERLLEAAVRASDAERLRIARDLHDGVVQDLAGSSMALSTLAARGVGPVADELEDVGRSLRVSMRSLRSLLVEIYPPDLHTAGLSAAVHDLVAPLVAAGVEVDADISGDEDAPPAAVALVWRVAQESVRNVARHAQATRMSLTVRREDDALVLEVVDDGVGFDVTTAAGDEHVGLRAAESLVREHGGAMEVESTPGSGTMVRVEVPVA